MSTPDTEPVPAPSASRRRRKKEDKKSLWQMDLSSIGKKDAEADEEAIDRPPFVPTLPRVNLLPTSIRDGIATRRIRRNVILAIVVVVLGAGVLWWLQGSRITAAQADLAAATTENVQLQSQLAALAPVKQMYDEITKLQNVVTGTLASQPQAAVVIERLANAGTQAGGNDIAFSSIDVRYQGIPVAGGNLNPCPNPNPFGTDATIGCISFSATAANRDQVAKFLSLLEQDDLFVGPYVTTSTVAETETSANQIAFTGSAGVSLTGLKTLLTDEQIAALLTPPQPTPAPTAEEGTS